MDIMTEMSIKIAEAAVPDEVDLAPVITDAFVQGEEEKKNLFIKQEDIKMGAFGPVEGGILFPHILQGIASTAPFILQVLKIETLDKYISTIKNFVDLRNKLEKKETSDKLPEDISAPLNKIFDVLSCELKNSGLQEEQCDRVVSNVILTLLKDPSGSFVFVEKVAGSA